MRIDAQLAWFDEPSTPSGKKTVRRHVHPVEIAELDPAKFPVVAELSTEGVGGVRFVRWHSDGSTVWATSDVNDPRRRPLVERLTARGWSGHSRFQTARTASAWRSREQAKGDARESPGLERAVSDALWAASRVAVMGDSVMERSPGPFMVPNYMIGELGNRRIQVWYPESQVVPTGLWAASLAFDWRRAEEAAVVASEVYGLDVAAYPGQRLRVIDAGALPEPDYRGTRLEHAAAMAHWILGGRKTKDRTPAEIRAAVELRRAVTASSVRGDLKDSYHHDSREWEFPVRPDVLAAVDRCMEVARGEFANRMRQVIAAATDSARVAVPADVPDEDMEALAGLGAP